MFRTLFANTGSNILIGTRSCIIDENAAPAYKLIARPTLSSRNDRPIAGTCVSPARGFLISDANCASGRPDGGHRAPAEAIKLQFHGLTPRKATRRDAEETLFYHSASYFRLAADCITAVPLIPLRISNGPGARRRRRASVKMLCQIPSRRLSFGNLPCTPSRARARASLRLIRAASKITAPDERDVSHVSRGSSASPVSRDACQIRRRRSRRSRCVFLQK